MFKSIERKARQTVAKEYLASAARAEKFAAMDGIETLTGKEALLLFAKANRDTANEFVEKGK